MTSDAGARRDATVRTDENIVLRASAGTGKTTVLVERMACLLLRDALDPELLVAITFTEMAAAEMKTRLRRRLMEAFRWGQGEDPKKAFDETVTAIGRDAMAARAQAALERLDRAAIETMHAFAARLLRMFPEEAGVDAAFAIEDTTAVQEALDRDWAAWSREEFASGSKTHARWRPVLAALPWPAVQELAFRLADWEDIPDDPGAIPADMPAWHGALLAAIEPLVKSAEGKTKKVTKVIEQARAAADVLAKAKAGGWRPLDAGDERFEGGFSDSYASTGWTEDEWMAAKSAYDAARAWAATRSEAVEAVRLLAGFAQYHREQSLAAGRLSFNALLLLARDLLRRRPHVARRFDKHRFLVDEFQDTDARQAEIVLRLASPPRESAAEWRDLRPRPGAVFIVGDGKQSIYAWRSADLGVYDAVSEQLVSAGALPRELSDNFRSQPGVIDAANRVFGTAFVEEPGIQAPPADLVAARPAKSLSGRIVALRTARVEGKAPALAAGEAAAIANWINDARGKLRIEVEEGDALLSKPMRFRDIAILMRATSHLPEYLRALRDAKIPYVVTREQHFYEAQEVRDAINLLVALVRPDDALALAGVMRSPAGGLTFDELHAAGRPDFRRNAAGKAGDFFAKLRDLRSRALRLPVPEAVDMILEESGLRAAAAASAHGEQALANLDKVAALAARWAAPELTLAAFADRLGRRLRDVEREAESPLGEPDDEVVRVSTIHAAKGLEWPVVILAGLHTPSRGSAVDDAVLSDPSGFAAKAGDAVTPGWAFLADRRRRRSEAENTRLFYVACTRAREALVLSRAGDGTGVFLKNLPSGIFTEEDADPTKRPPAAPVPPVAFPPEDERAKWTALAAEYEKLMKLPSIDSPTGMMHREDDTPDRHGHAWETRGAKETGIVVHSVLEHWNFAGDDLERALSRASADLREPDRAAALPRARALLQAFLKGADAQEIAAGRILGREVPFSMPLSDGRCIVGVIDIVFEKDGKLHVRDYKTGGENRKYETQQGIYVAAMKKLFPGKETVFRFLYLAERQG